MLHVLTEYVVPLNLVLLMLIAGTEIRRSDVMDGEVLRSMLAGALGQAVLLPAIAIGIVSLVKPDPVVGAAVIILSLCPGGGISNTYCYLARCSVLLSALMTAMGTLICLVSIPAWFMALPDLPAIEHRLAAVPAGPVLGRLVAYMIAPLANGAVARQRLPRLVEQTGPAVRLLALSVVAFVLAATLLLVYARFSELISDILVTVLGALVLKPEDFPLLATFLSGYLAAEIAIMVPYAMFASRTRTRCSLTVRP